MNIQIGILLFAFLAIGYFFHTVMLLGIALGCLALAFNEKYLVAVTLFVVSAALFFLVEPLYAAVPYLAIIAVLWATPDQGVLAKLYEEKALKENY